jgi:hypothetical protein
MTRTRWFLTLASVALLAGVAAYLYDPPWIAQVTSGMRQWEEDPPGTRFRWTTGRASFFIPSDATAMTLPMRALFPGANGTPVIVDVRVDDRRLAEVVLADIEAWNRPVLPLPRRPTRRRYRRVDLRVNRTVGFYILGVQTGEVALERPAPGR